MERIEILSRKLSKLRSLDRNHVVFGATGHEYKVNRWKLSDVEDLEAKLASKIPSELKEWLLRVGDGAAPCYGLEPRPSGRWEPDLPCQGDFRRLVDVKLPDLQRLLGQAHSKGENKFGRFDIPPVIKVSEEDGGPDLLYLGFAGCSDAYVTPLSGAFRGKVFLWRGEPNDDEDSEVGALFLPEGLRRTDTHENFENCALTYETDASRVFGFLDWMEYWLDTSLFLVRNPWRYELNKRRQRVRLLSQLDDGINFFSKTMYFLGLR